MNTSCPRCQTVLRPAARFCGRCGLLLESVGTELVAGRIRHPNPLPPPESFQPCGEAADLYYRWESAWGGSMLLGTEGIAVFLFSGGYPLRQVVLRIEGADDQGRQLLAVQRTVDDLPRGRQIRLELASYELPAPVRSIGASLVSAEFGPETGNP